ncbi:MAG: polyprenyl synthetase family protein [Clostridia bacterium]|nr:polyprenyl synthetase family protein [Clostridia bacterium]
MPELRLKEYSALVESGLNGLFPQEACRHGKIFEACRYSLLAGGKHIRAALLLEFYRLCGGRAEDAIPFACGLEMIHTYSLVHDDLPCMDNDDFRRGKPSNHKVYGETMATLAGDALLNRAFEVMLEQTAVPAERAVKAAAYISRCSGVYGMIGGQVQDLGMEGRPATLEELREMVSLKTGALIRAACAAGVLLAGGSEEQKKAAEDYAAAVGLAFQIQDDILDVVGDQAVLGKAIGSDVANEKTTFVSVYGLETCRSMVRNLTMEAEAAAETFADGGFLKNLAGYLAKRDN